jgi:hypothetical protein
VSATFTASVTEHPPTSDGTTAFIDDAATRLGHLIDTTAGTRDGQADAQGYLTARAYFGALIAFVLLQDQLGMTAIRPVDTAQYIHHLAQLTARESAYPGNSG